MRLPRFAAVAPLPEKIFMRLCLCLTVSIPLASVLLQSPPAIAETASLGPGQTLATTFTSTPNPSNQLFFFTNTPVVETGAPIITLNLYNGASLLGSIVGPPVTFKSSDYLQYQFVSSAGNEIAGLSSTVIDFSSINDGTIDGIIDATVSGGTISGIDLATFHLYDAQPAFGGSEPLDDVTPTGVVIQNVTPEPSSFLLLGTGMLGVAGLARKRFA